MLQNNLSVNLLENKIEVWLANLCFTNQRISYIIHQQNLNAQIALLYHKNLIRAETENLR